jgi:predicted small integral membrane protein
VQGMHKWEARVLGMIAIALLSYLFVAAAGAPRITVAFGAIAGLIAGGSVWEAVRGGDGRA